MVNTLTCKGGFNFMMNEVCRITMTDDDKYILEVAEKGKKNKDGYDPTEYKNYVANDHDELFAALKKYVPKIKSQKEKDDDKYDKGWNEDGKKKKSKDKEG